ncbi:MAG: hypothetical protein IBX68_07545 [Dehalococcoidia bacterium]|nr:hypothetical protein [Dehalococcoidia bacterium]
MENIFPVNIWINEERLERLQLGGLGGMAEEAFAGLKKLAVPANLEQRDTLLQKFPMAKYDSATTRSIELLPREAKDRIFQLVIETGNLNVMDAFLASI